MLDELMDAFRDPPARLRTMPQWSWNGELNEARITEQLEQFARQGCGGVFAHARPGLITGYISDEWFEMWGHGMREAERLGMEFHIYDEFCCPGGHAGGHVVARRPHLAQQTLELRVVSAPQVRPEGRVAACFRRDEKGALQPVGSSALRTASADAPVLALVVRAEEHRPEKGGFGLPDMLQRETAETFIETTHERYAERFADRFGRTVRFVFCDEPQVYGSRDGWPYSQHLLREFRHDHGYDLAGRLGALCFGGDGAEAVRFDYWRTVDRLFNVNFMKPLHDWCERQGLLFTGHLMENTWPSPRLNPDCMAALRWMQAPGTDLLGFQFSATTPAQNGIYFLNQKEASSVAAQLGRRHVLTESCGGRGYHASFELFKPCEDYLLALGVNVMDPHLAHQTLSGSRKYDWPQTLSDHSPWWAHYRSHADHVARANAVLSRGVERNRVLVLQPTTTAWMRYAPEPFRLGRPDEALDRLKQDQVDLLLALYGGQVDFDLGDEFILEDLGRAGEGRLVVGERAYDLVVVPPAMENWTAPTLELLRGHLESGGRVVGGVPTHVDGRASDAPAELQRGHADRYLAAPNLSALVDAVREAVPPRISAPDRGPLPDALCWRRVEVGEKGVLYFFCNPWAEPLGAEVRLEGGCLTELLTATGEAVETPARTDGDGCTVELDLPPHAHALYLCTPERPAFASTRVARERQPVELEARTPQRLAENVLLLDYCDLEVDGRRFEDIGTLNADGLNWRLQGFEQDPWQGAHQFNRTVIDRPVPEDGGFSVTYRFEVDAELGERRRVGVRVGIERPWLYRITLNGREVEQATGERWFDEQARAFPVGELVRTGPNALTLTAQPFHMLCEIMPVCVLGDFGLAPAARGFRVVAPIPPKAGDWTRRGMPFYADAVRYPFSFRLEDPCDGVSVRLGEWEGAVAAVRVDGGAPAVAYAHTEELRVEGPFAAGGHELSVDVFGNMRNRMGPHHAEGHPGPWTWIQCPEHMPPGEAYRLQPSGLYEGPGLWMG